MSLCSITSGAKYCDNSAEFCNTSRRTTPSITSIPPSYSFSCPLISLPYHLDNPSIDNLKTYTSDRPSMPSQKPRISLMESVTSLPKTVIDKLHSNKTAPLFMTPHTEGEEVSTLRELPCGHILRQKDGSSARSAGNGPAGSNKFLGDLVIAEATRCYICESDQRK